MKRDPVTVFSYRDHHRYHDMAQRSKWQCQFQGPQKSSMTVFIITKSLGFLKLEVDALLTATS